MLPGRFLERLRNQGLCDLGAFIRAHEEEPQASFRLNPLKIPFPLSWETEVVPWCPWGRLPKSRPVFAAHPAFHAGGFYVQEASSMFLWYVMDQLYPQGEPRRPLVIVDLCAAPGGKATLLASWKQDQDFLIAHEFQGNRLPALTENLWKWGVGGVMITGGPVQQWKALKALADVVVVDAPCSGEGLFRKDKSFSKAWAPHLNRSCALIQRRLLLDAQAILKPGGYMVYSTCTYHPEENLEQIKALIQQGFQSVDPSPPDAWQIVRLEEKGAVGYQFFPHLTPGEGFFISVVRKPLDFSVEEASYALVRKNEIRKPGRLPAWPEFPGEKWRVVEFKGIQYGIQALHEALIKVVADRVTLTAPGLPIGSFKGNEWHWHPAAAHATAWSLPLPVLEVTKEEALLYLACNTLPYKLNHYLQVSWQSLKLGLAKGHASRPFINLYPPAWRLRKIPESSHT